MDYDHHDGSNPNSLQTEQQPVTDLTLKVVYLAEGLLAFSVVLLPKL